MVIFTFSISSLIFYAGRMRKSNSNSHVSLGGVESCGRLGSSSLNRIFEHDAMYSRNTQFALTANRSQLQNHIKSTPRRVKKRDGRENVRHKHMYRECVLYSSVYLDTL